MNKPIILPVLVMNEETFRLKKLGLIGDDYNYDSEEMVFYNIDAVAVSSVSSDMTEIWAGGKVLQCPMKLRTVRDKIENVK